MLERLPPQTRLADEAVSSILVALMLSERYPQKLLKDVEELSPPKAVPFRQTAL